MNTTGRILLVLLASILLTIIPLPSIANYCRPALVFMFWIYIRIFMPDRFNFVLLILTGLLLDALLYTIIGQHVFAMVMSLWIINTRARRFVFFNLIQQMALVGILTMVYLYLIAAINVFTGHSVSMLQPLTVAIVSALLWPWLKLTLDDVLGVEYTVQGG